MNLKTEGLTFQVDKRPVLHKAEGGFEISVMLIINCVDENGKKVAASAVLSTGDFSRLCADVAMDIHKLQSPLIHLPPRPGPPPDLKLN